MEVKVTSYTGLQNPWKKAPVLNATEYATLQNEMAGAAGQTLPYSNPSQYGAGTDWQDAVFNRNAVIQNSDISIAGGTDRGSYYASISSFNQEGIVAEGKSYYERLAARLNTTTKVNDRLTVGWNVAYTHNQSNGVAENTEWGSPLGRALNIDPITPLY